MRTCAKAKEKCHVCVCVCHTIFECGRLAANPDVCGLQRSIGLHFAVLLAMTGQLQRNKLTNARIEDGLVEPTHFHF